MKLATLILATLLGVFSYPLMVHSDGNPSVRTIFVFKLDGTNHCEPCAGLDLDSMELELQAAGIEVFSRRKGYDGREGIAICGAPTGQINIYEIASGDLSAALSLGFKQLFENWLRQDSGKGRRPNYSLQTDPPSTTAVASAMARQETSARQARRRHAKA